MDYSKYTIVPYKNDAYKQNFMDHYREWKVRQFSSKWFDGDDIPVEMDVPSHSRPLHPFLTNQAFLRIFFNRLGRVEKRNMAMVCKGWSMWFLIETEPEVKERDYYRGAVHGNENGVITITKNYRLLERFCICTTMSSRAEIIRHHKRQERQFLKQREEEYEIEEQQGVKESRKRKRTDTDTDTAENDAESDVTDISHVRPITIIDCRALVLFKYQENGTYIVTRFHKAHNHPLASPESAIFLKGNRKMTEVHKQFVTKVKVLKLGGVKAYRGWKELCGGYDNIGATKVDFKNFVRDIKTYICNFDAQMFVENLIGRKDTCSSFYFDFIVDENKCLAGVFWADLICIKNYMLFGEVLSADATYGTNKYDMVFVPFTGVDHHKRCITFGAGLIGDESIECYTWLFKTFLEAMDGCQPRIIITDQDKSMKSVVPEVFKESTHRLCMWHIMKKLREKVSYQLFQDEDFKTRLNRCVWNNQLEPDEFEEQWRKIMTDYQLVEHEWFSDLYDLREQWIPAYFKDVSMSGLMRFLTPHLTLVEFWVCYESALEAQRHKQSKLNSDNKHSEIPWKTKSNLEVHASEMYSHNIFKHFQTELVVALSDCRFKDVEKIDETKIYILTDLQMPNKSWNVEYSPDNMEITCSSSMFQRMGLLCEHSLWILHNQDFRKIPNKDIMQRWTKAAMSKPVFDKDGKLIDVSQKFSDRKSLSTELWQEVYF
ncbi:protein FAR1-RELATED SEQUENCE 5-like [Silene latifolia]|uniref:protein FAR1-RELATED SEQUENCE 5-like n=1 Tax=Silene latifolia TaxID=37657 RepID=UPI003D7786D0